MYVQPPFISVLGYNWVCVSTFIFYTEELYFVPRWSRCCHSISRYYFVILCMSLEPDTCIANKLSNTSIVKHVLKHHCQLFGNKQLPKLELNCSIENGFIGFSVKGFVLLCVSNVKIEEWIHDTVHIVSLSFQISLLQFECSCQIT